MKHSAFIIIGIVAATTGLQADGPDPKTWDAVATKAANFLKSSQDAKGGWSTDKSPGVTGVVLTGLLKSGMATAKDAMAEKALKYIESLINREHKHIAGQDAKVQLQNYVTSINVMALTAANQSDKYKGIVDDAVKFLKKLQWDEDEGKNPGDDYYGGAGYDSKSRPDLSNSQFYLDALKAAGLPKDDPAFKKALVFVSRCQNLKSETNDQPWAKLINDGSFIYTAANGGVTKVVDKAQADGSLPGYGSMTYAGIKSLIYCGVSKDDPRVKKAYEWIQKNYSVDKNPGMPEARVPVGHVLLLSHHGQVARRSGYRHVGRCPGPKARLAQRHHRSPRQTATSRRQLCQCRQLDGSRPESGYGLRPDGAELLQTEVSPVDLSFRARCEAK